MGRLVSQPFLKQVTEEDDGGRLSDDEYQRSQLLCYSSTPPDTVHCKPLTMKLVNLVMNKMKRMMNTRSLSSLVTSPDIVVHQIISAGMM